MPSQSPPPAPPVLPISEHEDEIVAAVDANPVVVVIGETGSGKSTQLSQILHRRGYTRRGPIAVTQPRRVAAVSVSRFPHQYLSGSTPCARGHVFLLLQSIASAFWLMPMLPDLPYVLLLLCLAVNLWVAICN
jgi:hypothetical protein